MGRDDHNRRRRAVESVLNHAAQYPQHGLGYEYLPGVRTAFKDRRELVLALQHDWSRALWSRIEMLSRDPRNPRKGHLPDAGGLARAAWTETAVRHPVLRQLLDAHGDELGTPVAREEQASSTQVSPLALTRSVSLDQPDYRATHVA